MLAREGALLVGTIVTLNPASHRFAGYNARQSQGDVGVVLSSLGMSTIPMGAYRASETIDRLVNRRNTSANVLWQNGHRNSYDRDDLLALEGLYLNMFHDDNYTYETRSAVQSVDLGDFSGELVDNSKSTPRAIDKMITALEAYCARGMRDSSSARMTRANNALEFLKNQKANFKLISQDAFFGNKSTDFTWDNSDYVMSEKGLLLERQAEVMNAVAYQDGQPTPDVAVDVPFADNAPGRVEHVVPEPVTIRTEDLRRPDESFDDWLTRMVANNVTVTNEMINAAQRVSPSPSDDFTF